MRHPAFSIANPNRVRSLVGTFSTANQTGFHRADGGGYRLFTDTVLDGRKAQPAGRGAAGDGAALVALAGAGAAGKGARGAAQAGRRRRAVGRSARHRRAHAGLTDRPALDCWYADAVAGDTSPSRFHVFSQRGWTSRITFDSLLDDSGVRRSRIITRAAGTGEPLNGEFGRVARARRVGFCPAQGRPEGRSARPCAPHRRARLSPPARRRAAAQAFDPDADRHLPGGRGGGPLPVAAQLARRYRAQRQGDAGAVGRRAGQRDDAAAGRERRHR